MSCFDARFINFITKHRKTDQDRRVEASHRSSDDANTINLVNEHLIIRVAYQTANVTLESNVKKNPAKMFLLSDWTLIAVSGDKLLLVTTWFR